MAKQKKRTLAIVSALAMTMLAVGVTSATAHTMSIDTNVSIGNFDSSGGPGRVTSGNEKCLSRRTVKFFAFENQGTMERNDDVRTVVDQDRTSDNGAFFHAGTSPAGTDYWVVRAPRKDIGGANHDHICEADAAPFS